MATTAATTAPFDQFVKLNDQFAEIGSKVGKLYLDGYETAVTEVADFQRKLAEQSKIEGVRDLVNVQADLAVDVAKATTAATRKVLA
ncbi:MAG: hypothetical protein JST31_00145 [Actinobacteria bacterium]|nr:hypothetical protein [Actinomycetota bacterium]